MLGIIVAINNKDNLLPILDALSRDNSNAYIFIIEQNETGSFDIGALLNAGVHLAGLSYQYEIKFISLNNHQISISQNIPVSDFLKSNGYENNATKAIDLNCTQKSKDGYRDIYPVHSYDKTHNKKWFHYIVTIERDSFLPMDFISSQLNIKI